MSDVVAFDRDGWLAWRKGGIGASDVGAVLSLSRWSSPYAKWLEKLSEVTPDEETEAMEFGHDLEPVIAKRFTRQTGLYVAGEQTWCQHPDEPWARATLDGFVVESAGSGIDAALGGFEAKSTWESPKVWEEAIPVEYMAQVAWQQWVTGLERTWLGVFHANYGLKFRVYGPIERDEGDIETIVKHCRAFWTDHVLTGEPPPTDAHFATTDALRSIRADKGTRVDLDDEVAAAVDELVAQKAQAKALEESMTANENMIKAALADCTEGYWQGQPVVSWREQLRTDIDRKALRTRLPRVAERFTTRSPIRVLRPAKTKEN